MEATSHKKVSIIVAIWNVEPYIHKCLDSIISQTYPYLEIILVDDGSPDNCGEICDEYARKDERIKVIHQVNQGVSAARQAGLDAAIGDYVIHIDPDDFIDNAMIESLVTEIERRNIDMLTCNYYDNDGVEVRLYYEGQDDLLKKMLQQEMSFSLWNTLISHKFIVENKISFTPTWLCHNEDHLFIIRCLLAGAKSSHLNKAYYHYIVRSYSLVTTRSKAAFYSVKCYIDELEKIVSTSDCDFYNSKRYTYVYAYESRYWKEMKNLYPEIRERLLNGKNSDRYSIDSQLARCMKYPPCLVWFEAKVHKYFMLFLHKGLTIFKKI